MALAITNRGSGGHNVSSTSFTLSPSGNFAATSTAILCLAADNSGTGGAGSTFSSVTDSIGNTWVGRFGAMVRDPGAINDGVQGQLYECLQNVGPLQVGTVITVDFSANTVAKTWTLTEITASVGQAQYRTAWQRLSGAAATALDTTVSPTINVGEVVVAFFCMEAGTSQSVTVPDGDTTNGTWTTNQYAEIGTTTAGSAIVSQAKLQTTAASTQTYNVTVGVSCDYHGGGSIYREVMRAAGGGATGAANANATGVALNIATGDNATGAANANATGVAISQGDGAAAAGVATAGATGGSVAAADGAASGAATASAAGEAIQSGTGSAAGAATATGAGVAISQGDGAAAAGAATAGATGLSTATGDGVAAGAATATAGGASVATAAGSVTAIGGQGGGKGNAITDTVGAAAGAATATAGGASVATAAGASSGAATAAGAGNAITDTVGAAAGVAAATAATASVAAGDGASSGAATAAAAGDTVGGVVEAAGAVAGSSSVAGAGSAVVGAAGTAAGQATAASRRWPEIMRVAIRDPRVSAVVDAGTLSARITDARPAAVLVDGVIAVDEVP